MKSNDEQLTEKVKEIRKLLNDNFLLLGGFEQYLKPINNLLVDVLPFQYNNKIYYCPQNEQDCDIGINFFEDGGLEWKKYDENEYDTIIAELKGYKIDATSFVNDYFNKIESAIKNKPESAIKNKPEYKAPNLGSDGIDKKILESFIKTKENQNGFLSDDQVALSLSYFLRNRNDVLVLNPRSGIEGSDSKVVLQDVIYIIDNADLTNKKYITFPYRSGPHFTSVVIDIDKGEIIFSNSSHYDSEDNKIFGGIGGDLISNNIELGNLQNSLRTKFGNSKNFNVVNAKCPAQGDGYMCGVHTVINSLRFCDQSLAELNQAFSGTDNPDDNQGALDDVIESSQNQKNQLQLKLISAAKIWEEYGELYKGKSESYKTFDILNSKKIDEYIGLFENILEGNGLTTNESLAKIEIQGTIIQGILGDIKELYQNYKGGLIKNQFLSSPNIELFSFEERSNQNFDTKIRNFIFGTDDPNGLLDIFDKAVGELKKSLNYNSKTVEQKLVEIAKYIDSKFTQEDKNKSKYFGGNDEINIYDTGIITRNLNSVGIAEKKDNTPKSVLENSNPKKKTFTAESSYSRFFCNNRNKPEPSEDEVKYAKKLNGLYQEMPSPDGYSGIGAKCEVVTNETNQIIHFKISKVFAGGLAYESGLKVGDIIFLKKPIADLYLMEVATKIRNLDFSDIDKITDGVISSSSSKLGSLSDNVNVTRKCNKRDFFVKEKFSYFTKYDFKEIKAKFAESKSR